MSSRIAALSILLACLNSILYSGCRNAPMTGRQQLMILPESQEHALGAEAYRELLDAEPASDNANYVEMVERVGQRIAAAADRPEFNWEFRVLASEEQSACARPGGKVAVYDGLLPLCRNEAGLAVVMSHEIAHALARHSGERMSHTIMAEGGRAGVDILTEKKSPEDRQAILDAYDMGSKYFWLLPYSRAQESEADRMGLILMARAGYDPREAPRFWERFAAAKEGPQPPEWLSTHPADARRASSLRELVPTAMVHYNNAAIQYGTGESIPLSSGLSPSNRPSATGALDGGLNKGKLDTIAFSSGKPNGANSDAPQASRPSHAKKFAPPVRIEPQDGRGGSPPVAGGGAAEISASRPPWVNHAAKDGESSRVPSSNFNAVDPDPQGEFKQAENLDRVSGGEQAGASGQPGGVRWAAGAEWASNPGPAGASDQFNGSHELDALDQAGAVDATDGSDHPDEREFLPPVHREPAEPNTPPWAN